MQSLMAAPTSDQDTLGVIDGAKRGYGREVIR